MRNYSDITFRYIKENKKRSIFTIIGLILSLALISGVGFFGYSFKNVMVNRAMLQKGNYEAEYWGVTEEDSQLLKNDVDLYNTATEGYKGGYKTDINEEISIDINNYDAEGIKNVFSSKVIEGRVPENSQEIMIDNRFKVNNNISIGDKINLVGLENGEKLTYEIVGFYYPDMASGSSYDAKVIGSDNIYGNEYNFYFSLKDQKDKVNLIYEKAEKLQSVSMVDINDELLALKGQSSYLGINTAIIGLITIVVTIIVMATVFLIYNFINISLAERINQFGILRSIGATPKQIRNIVLKEGLIMCLIAVPFGVLFGFLGVDITTRILKDELLSMLETEFVMSFYPQVILITLILGIITILIATYGPAKKAGKISPVDILKNNGYVSKYKEKFVKGNSIRKIFGIEGWIAYKNIRKNKKSFTVTILSLTISLVMFVVFNVLNIKQNEELAYLKESSVIDFLSYTNKEDSNNMKKDISNIKGVDNVYEKASMRIPLVIDKDKLNSNDELYSAKDIITNYKLLTNSFVYYYNDDALNEMGLSEEELGENGVILVNNIVVNDGSSKRNIEITNYKVGDTIKIPKSLTGLNIDNEEAYEYIESEQFRNNIAKDIEEENVYDVVVKKIIEKDILSEYGYQGSFGMILSKQMYEVLDADAYSSMILGVSIDSSADNNIEKILNEVEGSLSKYGYAFDNYYYNNKRSEEMWMVINTFIYGFIIMVTLISVVNIISTISLNILLKRRELATLSTIGMDKNKVNKMILLEGSLYGVIASFWGGIISVILVSVMVKVLGNGVSLSYSIPVAPFIVGFISIIGISLVASLIPLRKLRKISLVEAIRNEE